MNWWFIEREIQRHKAYLLARASLSWQPKPRVLPLHQMVDIRICSVAQNFKHAQNHHSGHFPLPECVPGPSPSVQVQIRGVELWGKTVPCHQVQLLHSHKIGCKMVFAMRGIFRFKFIWKNQNTYHENRSSHVKRYNESRGLQEALRGSN